MKKHIPNTLTSLNLFSGCLGVLFALQGEFLLTFYCVLASGVFDFFDGMIARVLHVKSNIGKELDSLADVISFGFLPGVVMYMLLNEAEVSSYWAYGGFLVTVFSALRLAKFNVDERQATDFIGLNTPMNTFFIISLPFIAQDHPQLIINPWVLSAVILCSCVLLVSEIKLFSMKVSSLRWQENGLKYVFVFISLLLIVILGFLGLPFVLLLYIAFSQLYFARKK